MPDIHSYYTNIQIVNLFFAKRTNIIPNKCVNRIYYTPFSIIFLYDKFERNDKSSRLKLISLKGLFYRHVIPK